MSLKSIKKNYTTLLKAFSEAGAKLNESQKESLDNFVTDLENTMNEQRDKTILATKKMVEEKLENEYKTVVESIIRHQKEHSEIAGKVQDKVVELNESNKIADAVDSYLNEYIEEVLPKKTIVDYTRMQKLEKIHESLKNMLALSESEIDGKANEKKTELEGQISKLNKMIDEKEQKINESKKSYDKLSKEMSQLKAKEFVSEKIKDLPLVESKKVLKKTSGMTLEQVKKNYKTILESVQEEVKDEQEVSEDEKNLEEAITDILEGKKKASEEEKKNSEKDAEGSDSVQEPESGDEAAGNNEGESDEDEPESVPVTESQMMSWIDTFNRFTPIK